jgi:osmoprotectant transport system ATP-binding protein
MDEPFGAVDPIARGRLQQEFLALQERLHKTVMFVTHDVDEAVVMGNRIAVLSQGGRLQQYDTPAEVLGHPATSFVADFIGADRGLRRLSVTPIEVSDLYVPPAVQPGTTIVQAGAEVDASGDHWAAVVSDDGRLLGWVQPREVEAAGGDGARGTVERYMRPLPPGAPVALGSNLKAAFAEMLQQDAAWVPVFDGDRYLGVLTPDTLHAALRRSLGGEPVPV